MKPLIVLMMLLIIGCVGDQQEPTSITPPQAHRVDRYPQQPPSIIGRWNWIESLGMFGIVVTPATEGYTEILQFDQDSNFYLFKNDTLLRQDKYEIIRGRGWTSDTNTILIIGKEAGRSQTEDMVEFFGTDTLKLSLLAVDGGYGKYNRLKIRRRTSDNPRRTSLLPLK